MRVSPLRGSVKRLEAGDSSSRAMQIQTSVVRLTPESRGRNALLALRFLKTARSEKLGFYDLIAQA
jgi:hypothetical protein